MTDSTLPAPSNRHVVSAHRLIAVLLASLLAMMIIGTAGATSPRSEGLMAVAAQDAATPIPATPVAVSGCEAIAPGVGSEPWVRTELYFGTTMPDGTTITDGDWQAFLDEEITPRFPAGLTILEGYGQFLNSQGVIAAEDSIVLIIFYPADAVEDSSASLEEIRDIYEQQFEQESVLRVDSAPVCISF